MLASITPSAPLANCSVATAVSSTAIRSWASVADVGRDLHDRAHQPGEQIDAVNGLVHQRAAAVEFPGAAPGAAVVVGLRAKPLHVGIAQRQPAEPPCVDGPFQFEARVVKPRGEDGRQLDLVLLALAMIWSQRLSVISSGFSTITCLPARAAATAGSMCAPLGVPIVTTSTAGSASMASRS